MPRPDTVASLTRAYIASLGPLEPRERVQAAIARALAKKVDLMVTSEAANSAEIVNRLAQHLETTLDSLTPEG